VRLPGQVWGLAAADAGGPIFLTTFDGRNLNATVVLALDLDGEELWRRTFDGRPRPPGVGIDGSVWIARQSAGHTITQLGADGSERRSITPAQEAGEVLKVFAVLPDGLCTVWVPVQLDDRVTPTSTARVARHDLAGNTLWSTPLILENLSYPGVLEISIDTDGEVRPKRPWAPTSVEVGYREPLLISGDRVLVEISDRGGIGVCSLLDLATGGIVAVTAPAPYQRKAIDGPRRFLIGRHGYSAAAMELLDREGRVTQTWPTHGLFLVDRHGRIRGPESVNDISHPSLFRALNPDGSMSDGPSLTGYYTADPAMDVHGAAVFWRDGQLLAVDPSAGDADRQLRVLFARPDERVVMSRVLLLRHGLVVFALQDELLLFRDTGLGPLDDGPWPCADGNLQGNPVQLA
jgi:hypothetical protein